MDTKRTGSEKLRSYDRNDRSDRKISEKYFVKAL